MPKDPRMKRIHFWKSAAAMIRRFKQKMRISISSVDRSPSEHRNRPPPAPPGDGQVNSARLAILRSGWLEGFHYTRRSRIDRKCWYNEGERSSEVTPLGHPSHPPAPQNRPLIPHFQRRTRRDETGRKLTAAGADDERWRRRRGVLLRGNWEAVGGLVRLRRAERARRPAAYRPVSTCLYACCAVQGRSSAGRAVTALAGVGLAGRRRVNARDPPTYRPLAPECVAGLPGAILYRRIDMYHWVYASSIIKAVVPLCPAAGEWA